MAISIGSFPCNKEILGNCTSGREVPVVVVAESNITPSKISGAWVRHFTLTRSRRREDNSASGGRGCGALLYVSHSAHRMKGEGQVARVKGDAGSAALSSFPIIVLYKDWFRWEYTGRETKDIRHIR